MNLTARFESSAPATGGRQPRRQRRLRIPHIPPLLGVVLAAGALLCLAWDVALPAFQGPDEDAHFAYIQHFAETGEIPNASTGNSTFSLEQRELMHTLHLHALRGVAAARPDWSSADLALWHKVENGLPAGARSDGNGPNPVAKNPPLYYALMAIPYRVFVWLPLLQRLFVLRLINGLFYLATIAFTWLLAGELFGRQRWKQLLAAGAVALEPQLQFMGATLNADNLLFALCSGFLLAAVRVVTRGPTARRVLTASAFSAGAVLTHGRGLVTVPVLIVALFVAWARHRPAVGAVLSRCSAAGAVVAAALGVEYLVTRSSGGGGLYGGQVGSLNSGGFNLRQFLSFVYQFYFPKLAASQRRIGPLYGYRQVFINTFYGTFGWLEVAFAPRVYDVLEILSGIGLLSFYTACVARWRVLRRNWGAVLVLLAMLVVQIFFLHYVSYEALLGNGATDPVIVGRYLLPMVSLFGVAIAFTVGSLPRRAGPVLATLVLALGILLSLGGLGITVARFYA